MQTKSLDCLPVEFWCRYTFFVLSEFVIPAGGWDKLRVGTDLVRGALGAAYAVQFLIVVHDPLARCTFSTSPTLSKTSRFCWASPFLRSRYTRGGGRVRMDMCAFRTGPCPSHPSSVLLSVVLPRSVQVSTSRFEVAGNTDGHLSAGNFRAKFRAGNLPGCTT